MRAFISNNVINFVLQFDDVPGKSAAEIESEMTRGSRGCTRVSNSFDIKFLLSVGRSSRVSERCDLCDASVFLHMY